MRHAPKPIRVFYSEFSCRLYATRAWREVVSDRVAKDGSIHQVRYIEVTGQQFDVTDDIAAIIKKHDIEFTPLADPAARAVR
jgi:hypothetical protein